MPAPHRTVDPRPHRERPDPVRVEQVVAVPRVHALAVEAVAQVQPDRERVVADPLVEPTVDAATGALGWGDGDRIEVVLAEHAGRRRARAPPIRRTRSEGS